MNMEVTTNINVKQLYEFTIKHNYKSLAGMISLTFSICSAIGGFIYWDKFNTMNKVVIILFALMFTVLEPIGCYIKVRKQIKNNFKYPIRYVFGKEGIEIIIEDKKGLCYWYEIMKIESTHNLINIYTSPVRAFIIPKSDVGEDITKLRELIETYAECRKVAL